MRMEPAQRSRVGLRTHLPAWTFSRALQAGSQGRVRPAGATPPQAIRHRLAGPGRRAARPHSRAGGSLHDWPRQRGRGDEGAQGGAHARTAEHSRQVVRCAASPHRSLVAQLQRSPRARRVRTALAPCLRAHSLTRAVSRSSCRGAFGRLVEAQGENHVLVKYENGAALPPPSSSLPVRQETSLLHRAPTNPQRAAVPQMGSSAPITIGGSMAHWRGGHSTSPQGLT